uniref:Part of AAA domain-containing protein n=1 Tax=Candidatus Kentrum sp. LFY TaxID=2126342 RepID=A0A450X6W8_9GAMM|nr:MAG: Part of AAA domain-containing protein [Candidatus Kentron sp. LFY]
MAGTLIIEGPPGTGKSQTIANLIAATMARGKRVLFVAEKMAALEVVRRRLDAAGLGEFCLELHSHKTQKRKVLDEIEFRLKKHGHYRMPRDIDVDIARYEEMKTTLKGHVERINRPWKNTGKTLHEIFMTATRYRREIGINPDVLHPEGYDGENLDATAQRRMEDQVAAFQKIGYSSNRVGNVILITK